MTRAMFCSNSTYADTGGAGREQPPGGARGVPAAMRQNAASLHVAQAGYVRVGDWLRFFLPLSHEAVRTSSRADHANRRCMTRAR